ncbi:MAG: hypothetical protein ACQERD_04310 [Campylobacterota bacterium]
MIDVLIITVSKPILIGVYENNHLIKSYKIEGKSSDMLPIYFQEIFSSYDVNRLNYVNTPGSFMAIKVAYVFLKTLSITKKLDLRACSGFEFNQNSPIKALGKKYFIKYENSIKVDFLQKDSIIRDFELPKSIEKINFNKQTLPIYNLPAV